MPARYVVRSRNAKDGTRTKEFLRGYGFQGGQGTGFSFAAPGFGDDYKRSVKNPESSVRLAGFGECHELGVARMGGNPKTAVLNQFQQAHDVKNLFVMDGAGFTSGACQNPTLTIMALSVRSTDYLMGELKRGSL